MLVHDSRDVQDLNLKQTFVGKVMSEEASNPQAIFACQADSIEDLEKVIFKNVWHSEAFVACPSTDSFQKVPDRSAVRIFPLETVHTSTLEREEDLRDS